MKNKFINEDLKSLQDLQEKYEMKRDDILDRLIDDNNDTMSPEEFRNLPKELKKIKDDLEKN